MKILYIHQYFFTPDEPGGTRSYWIAKKLLEDGHDVIMLTSDQKGTLIKPVIKWIDGLKVIYVPNKYDNNMGFLRRLLSFLSFMLRASQFAIKEKEVDLVFATSTPLTIGVPALIKKWMHKTPFIFEVRDLWPEVPIQMGALNNALLRKVALFLEKLIYKNALHVVALSPGMEEGVLRYGFMKGKTSMIPNMSKVDEFYPRDKAKKTLKRFNLNPDFFNAVHFGAMGIANGLDYIVKAAIEAQSMQNDKIQFHFLGSGIVEDELKEIKRINNLTNVHFHGKHNMQVVSSFVNCCDVSIVSFKNLPILATNSPNKLFDSLSAGIPIIVNSKGWTKDLVENYNCGVFVNPTDPIDLINTLNDLMNSQSTIGEMGLNARKLAEDVYDKKILTQKMSDLINQFLHAKIG